MTITDIGAYSLPFRFRGGGYVTAYGRRERLDNVLLCLTADDGVTGYGEVCKTPGKTPPPNHADIVPGLQAITQKVLAATPDSEAVLDAVLSDLGAPSAIRNGFMTAFLDLTARRAGLPLDSFLGGRRGDSVPVYGTIGSAAPDTMAAAARGMQEDGIWVIQMKVGGALDADLAAVQAVLDALGPDATLLADANGGWSTDVAVDALSAIQDPRLIWEEPCVTYAENRSVAEKTGRMLKLDQCLDDLTVYARFGVDGFAAAAGIKPTVLGSLRAAAAARHLCAGFGIRMKIDDSWCTSLGSAATLAVALGAPKELLLCSLDMGPYFEEDIASTATTRPHVTGNRYHVGAQPGLGLTPDLSMLASPLFSVTGTL